MAYLSPSQGTHKTTTTTRSQFQVAVYHSMISELY